jgi:hypothetical protein
MLSVASGNLAATSYDRGKNLKKLAVARINKARAVRVAKALEGEAKPMVVTDTTEVIVKPKRGRKPKARSSWRF